MARSEGKQVTIPGSSLRAETFIPTGSLLAYYALSNVNDGSGNGYDLTAVNSPTFTSTGAKIGSAVDLEFNSSQWLTQANAAFGLTGNFSLGGWFKIESKFGNMLLACKQDAPGAIYRGYGLSFNFSGDRIDLGLGNASADVTLQSTVTPLSVATWYFVCARRNTTLGKLYLTVNGTTDEVNTSQALTACPSDFTLGAFDGGASGGFDGMLDEWFLYNRDIGTLGVDYWYNSGNGRTL